MRRELRGSLEETRREGMQATTSVRRTVPLRGWLDEVLVVGLVILALLLGWALKDWVQSQTVPFTSDDGLLSVQYPAHWLGQVDKGALLTVSDVRGEGAFKATFSVSARGMDPGYPLTQSDLLVMLSVRRAEELTAYRVLSMDQGMVDGLEASKVEYAYVVEPAGGLQNSLPVVVEAADYVVIYEGSAYVLTFAAVAEHFAEEEGVFDSILASVEFS
jgi:hypothetical protein